jgi:hypothetical protein
VHGPRWPADAFPAGSRVTVIKDPYWDGPWQQEFPGTVDALSPPELVNNPRAHEGESAYWVEFDDPQYAADGLGPYRKTYIWARYLRPEPIPDSAVSTAAEK